MFHVRRRALGVLGSLVLVAACACGPRPSAEDPTPIDVSLPPEQAALQGAEPIRVNDGGWTFTITPLASYVLRGVVVSRENYHFDWNTDLSPCDVAMVWGELEAGGAWRRLDWSQGGRWYFWRWSGEEPFPNVTVVRNSSNTHIVPADSNLARAARSLSEGDLAELSGELVAIEGRKGGQTVRWRSSLSREDTGDGSCEILYLRRLRVAGKVYE
ncbi:MAG TPA: hypothetical protein PLB88_06450 [Thermoanaerobaculaceae bacterium]|nr:hypothetical protein [Thermoanaerobaculaceae bacterium]